MDFLDAVLGVLLCAYVVLLPIVPDKVAFKKVPAVDWILGIIVLFYLLKIILSSKARKRFIEGLRDFFTDYLSIFMLLLTIVMAASITYAAYRGTAISETARFITYIALYFIIKYEVKGKSIKLNIIRCCIFVATVLSIFGIYQYFTGVYLDKTLFQVKRIASTMLNPNTFAAFLVILIFPVIMIFINEKNKIRKLMYLCIVALLGVNIALTGSRNAYLGLGIGCIIIILIYSKKLLPVFMGVFVLLMLIPKVRTRVMQIGDSSENASRLKLWHLALRMFEDHPVRGVGNGNYVKLHALYLKRYPQYYYYSTFKEYPSHNSYLKILSELGILGFIPFAAMLVAVILKLKKFINVVKDKFYKAFYIGFFASALAFLFMNISDNLLFVPSVATYFWILLAISQSILYDLEK